MKLITIVIVIVYCCLIRITEMKMFHIHMNDEIYPYDLDPSVNPFTDYLSSEHIILEQLDDDKVKIGGYLTCVKSMNPNLPLQLNLRSKYLERSIWREGTLRLAVPSMCEEHTNPSRFWYNITKLWFPCPPQKGDKWVIEDQIISVNINLPASIPMDQWRGYILITQFGTTLNYGLMVQLELIETI